MSSYKTIQSLGNGFAIIAHPRGTEQHPDAIYGILKPNGWIDARRFETVTDASIVAERMIAETKPLQITADALAPMTLTLKQLQTARNELKTLSYDEVGAIIHGLRRVLQLDPRENALTAHHLIERLTRATIVDDPLDGMVGQTFKVTGGDEA